MFSKNFIWLILLVVVCIGKTFGSNYFSFGMIIYWYDNLSQTIITVIFFNLAHIRSPSDEVDEKAVTAQLVVLCQMFYEKEKEQQKYGIVKKNNQEIEQICRPLILERFRRQLFFR